MKLLYRADGGHPIGTGHIYRATRLLRSLNERCNLSAVLLTSDDAGAINIAERSPARIDLLPARTDRNAVKPMLSAAPVLDRLKTDEFDLVVVDMLDTPHDEMKAIADTGVPLLTFDDRGEGRFYANAIINILVKEPKPEQLPPSTQLYEGGSYVVIDPIFAEAHKCPPFPRTSPARRILVSMGGADASGLTVKVARALRQVMTITHAEFTCGPSFPHMEELELALTNTPWRNQIHIGLPNLLERFRWCDLAIVAGGLTMYEACCLGTPSLAVCQPIDHQFELAQDLSIHEAMSTVGYGADVTVDEIAKRISDLAADEASLRLMERRGPTIVDGNGTERVVDIMLKITGH